MWFSPDFLLHAERCWRVRVGPRRRFCSAMRAPGGLCASSRRDFQALERREPRIDGGLAGATGCILVDPALRAQPLAGLGAQRRERDRQHELLAEERLEIDTLAVEREHVEVVLADL